MSVSRLSTLAKGESKEQKASPAIDPIEEDLHLSHAFYHPGLKRWVWHFPHLSCAPIWDLRNALATHFSPTSELIIDYQGKFAFLKDKGTLRPFRFESFFRHKGVIDNEKLQKERELPAEFHDAARSALQITCTPLIQRGREFKLDYRKSCLHVYNAIRDALDDEKTAAQQKYWDTYVQPPLWIPSTKELERLFGPAPTFVSSDNANKRRRSSEEVDPAVPKKNKGNPPVLSKPPLTPGLFKPPLTPRETQRLAFLNSLDLDNDKVWVQDEKGVCGIFSNEILRDKAINNYETGVIKHFPDSADDKKSIVTFYKVATKKISITLRDKNGYPVYTPANSIAAIALLKEEHRCLSEGESTSPTLK